MKPDKELLVRAVINQIHADLGDDYHEELHELLLNIIQDPHVLDLCVGFLSASARESWLKGETILIY